MYVVLYYFEDWVYNDNKYGHFLLLQIKIGICLKKQQQTIIENT